MAKDIDKQLVSYLRDAHAMEQQSLQTLEAAVKVAGDPQLEALYRGHIRETKEHLSHIANRLEAHGASSSKLKDVAMRVAAVGVGAGLVAQPDTPAKLAAVAYAFESFEVASYELLKRVAERAGDGETVAVAERILVHERQAIEKIGAGFDMALERSLEGSMSG